MPRKAQSALTSQLHRIQALAQKVVGKLSKEIRSKEAELARVKDEFAKLIGFAGRRKASPAMRRERKARSSGGPSRNRRRINWSAVLSKLPKQFQTSDIRTVWGLKDKPSADLFAAITRWIDGGVVRKKARGVYRRLK